VIIMQKVVMGIVDTPAQAELTVQRLQSTGFSPGDISILFPDKHGARDFAFEQTSKAPEGALTGAIVGGVVGAAIGIAAGVGVLAVPGLGMLIAAGPLLAGLATAAVLAVVFGAVGALIGRAMPRVEAKPYAGKVKRGSILVAVHAEDRRELRRAREVLDSVAASDVTSTTEATVPVEIRV
jgi:hypothetical protein